MKTRIPIILLAAIALVSQARAHEPKLSLHEITNAADVIVIATVESAVAGPSKVGRSVRTTVTFKDVEVVAVGDRAAAFDDRFTITFAGGSIPGGLTTSVCDQPQFDVGERWMLFALHDGRDYLNPFVGGPQGMYRITTDRETGRPYPVRPGGGAIIRVEDGDAISTPRLHRIDHGIAFCASPDRGLMQPPVSRNGGDAVSRRVETEHLPMTLDEFRAEVERLRAAGPPAKTMLPDRDAAGVAPKLQKAVIERAEPLKDRPEATDVGRGTLCACGAHGDFAVMEQVNSGWWSYSENELGMAQWNNYWDLFRYTPDDGTWGENGDHEFGGFPSNAELASTWGSTWGTAIAKTLMTFSSVCGTIEEADIVFNPAFSYGTSIGGTIETNTILYQPVVMHELGHAWGYITNLGGCDEDYSYDYHSVMHAYYSGIFEDGRGVHVSDSSLMRLHYIGLPVPLVPGDIGVESYYIDGGSLARAFTDLDDGSADPTVYHHGLPITISGVTIENMGFDVSDLRLRIWLSQDLFVNAADHVFDTYFEWTTFGGEAYWTGDISATIPSSVPQGEYWVGLVVSTGGDAYEFDHIPGNNTTFLTRKIIVNPPPPANDLCADAEEVFSGTTLIDTSYAYTDGQNVGCGAGAGVNNDVWFRYHPPCDGRLTISTCGQSPTFDTSIALYRDDGMCPPNAYLGCAGQGTGCASGEVRITYTVTEDVPYLIRVGGAAPGEFGVTGLDIHLDGIVPNDFCTNPLNVSEGTYEVDNRCATTDGAPDACGQMYNDLWYRIAAPCGGYLVASTCDDADFDTQISIYLGAGSCPGSILYGCSNDAPTCTDGRSYAVADVSPGRFYWIRVGGDTDADRGVATLEIRCFDDCPDVDGSGAVDFTDLNILLDNWQETVTPGTMGDVDFSGTVDFGDLNLLLDQWGDPCP